MGYDRVMKSRKKAKPAEVKQKVVHQYSGSVDCTLGNSGICYSDGMVTSHCSCGWTRICGLREPVIVFLNHVAEELQK